MSKMSGIAADINKFMDCGLISKRLERSAFDGFVNWLCDNVGDSSDLSDQKMDELWGKYLDSEFGCE